MSTTLIAYHDEALDAVVIATDSGTTLATLPVEDAASLGEEILAASRRESTGYEEFLAQSHETHETGESGYGDDDPDAQALADADDALRRLAE